MKEVALKPPPVRDGFDLNGFTLQERLCLSPRDPSAPPNTTQVTSLNFVGGGRGGGGAEALV